MVWSPCRILTLVPYPAAPSLPSLPSCSLFLHSWSVALMRAREAVLQLEASERDVLPSQLIAPSTSESSAAVAMVTACLESVVERDHSANPPSSDVLVSALDYIHNLSLEPYVRRIPESGRTSTVGLRPRGSVVPSPTSTTPAPSPSSTAAAAAAVAATTSLARVTRGQVAALVRAVGRLTSVAVHHLVLARREENRQLAAAASRSLLSSRSGLNPLPVPVPIPVDAALTPESGRALRSRAALGVHDRPRASLAAIDGAAMPAPVPASPPAGPEKRVAEPHGDVLGGMPVDAGSLHAASPLLLPSPPLAPTLPHRSSAATDAVGAAPRLSLPGTSAMMSPSSGWSLASLLPSGSRPALASVPEVLLASTVLPPSADELPRPWAPMAHWGAHFLSETGTLALVVSAARRLAEWGSARTALHLILQVRESDSVAPLLFIVDTCSPPSFPPIRSPLLLLPLLLIRIGSWIRVLRSGEPCGKATSAPSMTAACLPRPLVLPVRRPLRRPRPRTWRCSCGCS